jgi:hypothetical protein
VASPAIRSLTQPCKSNSSDRCAKSLHIERLRLNEARWSVMWRGQCQLFDTSRRSILARNLAESSYDGEPAIRLLQAGWQLRCSPLKHIDTLGLEGRKTTG